MVKFARSEVERILTSSDEVVLTITGSLYDEGNSKEATRLEPHRHRNLPVVGSYGNLLTAKTSW